MNKTKEAMKSLVPEGKSGDWEVSRFSVSKQEADLDRMRSMFSFSGRGRYTPEGSYTKLAYRGNVVMSDTPDELSDHLGVAYEAQRRGGEVLVNGLGLGCVVQGMFSEQSKVERVTVIEKSSDVISLVAPHIISLFGDKVRIIHADAFDYKPEKGIRFTVVWHDIWPNMCVTNLVEMTRLHRKYGSKCDWQGSWGKEWIKARMR